MEFARRSVPVAALALVLAACAGAAVRTDHDPAAGFGDLRSFAWLERGVREVEDPLLDSQLLGRKVREAVTVALGERGYAEVTAADADFLVTYHTTVRERVRDSGPSFSLTFGSVYRRGPRTIVVDDRFGSHSYREGTLIIDVIDARTDTLIWRGWSSGAVHERRFTETAVAESVRAILARFPP